MPTPILIPGYDRSDTAWHYDTYPGVLFDLPMEKGVLHSTEGVSLPTYGVGGTDAPNVTIDPWRRLRWQHHPLNAASRALVNPASTEVSENRDRVWQVEIIGCSDTEWAAKIGRPDRDLDRLTDDDYDWLGEQIALMCDLTGVPPTLTTSRPWLRYPASYGNSPARMSGPEYDAYRGILGHMHVSGNLHGDPKIDRDRMQAAVTRHSAASDPKVAAEQVALNDALAGWPGYVPITVDGIDGPKTQAAQEAYEMTLANLETKLDAIGVKLDTHATALDRIEAAVRGIPRAVAGFVSNGRDLVTWMRLGAGALRLTPEGTEVGILPPVPPLAADDVLSKPAKP